jgi:hypothetical protein
MKRIKLILVCGLTLAMTGLTMLLVAAGAPGSSTAIVKDLQGNVTYQPKAGGGFKPLKTNQELQEGDSVKTGPGGTAYLSVNGKTSAVKVEENTTMVLTKMSLMGEDTTTTLQLDGGTLLGSVRKVSANSEYKVLVPGGVAAIRGTDWKVTVTYQGSGNFTVTFASGSGTVYCQVTLAPGVPGQNTQNLTTGQSWTVSGSGNLITVVGTPGLLPPAAFKALEDAIEELLRIVFPPPPPGGGGRRPPVIPQPVPPGTNPSQTGGR